MLCLYYEDAREDHNMEEGYSIYSLISLMHSCLCMCRCDGNVICVGYDLDRLHCVGERTPP